MEFGHKSITHHAKVYSNLRVVQQVGQLFVQQVHSKQNYRLIELVFANAVILVHIDPQSM